MRSSCSLLCSVLLVACVDPGDGQFTCPDGVCPSGFHCWSDAVCHDSPEGDAAVDVMIDVSEDVNLPDSQFDTQPDAGPARALDLLLVIDDSNSMRRAQQRLSGAFEPLVLGLVAGNYEGLAFEPITDLQVGVVTTDMGVGGHIYDTITRCNDSPADRDFGADGVLQTNIEPASGCGATYPAILRLDPLMTAGFIDDAECKIELGIGGCGFEQPLEAMMKAVTPESSGAIFHDETRGHGDTTNAGMIRDDSVLAVLILTDEEDCSAVDADLFDPDPGNTSFPGHPATRCIDYHATALHPTSRYVDALRALRVSQPGRVVFGGLVGLPTDVLPSDFDALQADPRMVPRTSGGMFDPEAVCTGTVGSAGAAPRFVDTAERLHELGSRAVLESICADDYSEFFGRFIAEIVDAL